METLIPTVPAPTRDGVSVWLKLVTAFSALFATTLAVRYAGQPLLDAHFFRQTQTALTAFWLMRNGWHMAYETPVAGYPWSIPFEFPLYEALTAFIAKFSGFPLDPVGRLLSFTCLLGCAWPASEISNRLRLTRRVVWVFCALLWSSPIYVFWGRAFMIETMALFFAFAFIPYALGLVESHPRRTDVLFCATFGSLACLQKVTTGAPVILVLGFVWLIHWLRREGLRLPTFGDIARPLCAFGLPLMIGVVWNVYADATKARNPFGAQLTSSALVGFTWGTLQQRLAWSTYVDVFWNRVFVANAGGLLGVALVVGAVFLPGVCRLRGLVLTALGLFVVPILLFTNLHIEHTYYQTSCLLFLTGAVACAVAVWVPRIIPQPAAVPVLTAALVASNLLAFEGSYAPVMRAQFEVSRHRTLAVAEVLRDYTPSGSAFVAFGFDWSSELAYYAQRKSFTVPGFFVNYVRAWEEPARYLGDVPLGALVVCPPAAVPSAVEVEQRFESSLDWILIDVMDCRILLNQNTPGP